MTREGGIVDFSVNYCTLVSHGASLTSRRALCIIATLLRLKNTRASYWVSAMLVWVYEDISWTYRR